MAKASILERHQQTKAHLADPRYDNGKNKGTRIFDGVNERGAREVPENYHQFVVAIQEKYTHHILGDDVDKVLAAVQQVRAQHAQNVDVDSTTDYRKAALFADHVPTSGGEPGGSGIVVGTRESQKELVIPFYIWGDFLACMKLAGVQVAGA